MENKRSIKDKIAYHMSVTLRAESAILGSGCGGLGALEKHLPGISYIVSKSLLRVWCCARSNSHRLKARC